MAFDQKTSLISLLSGVHGRLRREERDIDKRDLQAALKYGTRERNYKGRWKVEHDGIIFITDVSMRKEITAFPSPLSEAPIKFNDRSNHTKAKTILERKPELCKSHTVLVVDNSGSMQTHDIPLHRDRQVAAYSTIALEFIAEQLFNQTANDTDVVSLVEFNETAQVIFEREPCSWILYNKLLARRETGDFESRERIKDREIVRADSNYLPALASAKRLLELDRHDACALAVYFLSDGEPSDARNYGWTTLHTKSEICSVVTDLATTYSEHILMAFVGFGNEYGDFSTLQAMTDACNSAPGPAKAEFQYCEKVARSLGSSLMSLATSLTLTRTSLMGRGASLGQKRTIKMEKETGVVDTWHFYFILNHWIYSPKMRRLVNLPSEPPGALRDESEDSQNSREKNAAPPPFLAMNTSSCGQGAERFAFRCFLANKESKDDFTLGAMVAKESSLVNQLSENVEFHRAFCETQSLASFLADEFNKRVRASSEYDPTTTPIITFLPCSILELEDHSVSGGLRGVLVEKKLDMSFGWNKWNDNGGGLVGQPYHAPLDIEYEMESLNQKALHPSNGVKSLGGVIEEGSEDEEDSDDESADDESADDEFESKTFDNEYIEDGQSNPGVAPGAYLQAFSHFTYVFTNRKRLVCDLQGVYNTSTVPPRFELTDPAIHYRSKKGRRMVYGRTDKGENGMRLFFKTHKCSAVCKRINMCKNVNWHRAWCSHHQQTYA